MEEHYYSEYFEVEDRHWWFVGRRRIFMRLLDRHLGPAGAEARRVLDAGCGSGTMLRHLARYGEAEGMDADGRAVAACRRRGIERVRQVESLPLPWDDGTFDLVTALDVLEHADEDGALLRELRRVTRPGGLLLVSVPAFAWLWGAQDELSHHKRRYTAGELEERIRDAGLEPRRVSYFNTLLFAPIAAVRLLRRLRPPRELRSDFELTKPGRLNDALARVFAAEAPLVDRLRLPFGVSILALAARPGPRQ